MRDHLLRLLRFRWQLAESQGPSGSRPRIQQETTRIAKDYRKRIRSRFVKLDETTLALTYFPLVVSIPFLPRKPVGSQRIAQPIDPIAVRNSASLIVDQFSNQR